MGQSDIKDREMQRDTEIELDRWRLIDTSRCGGGQINRQIGRDINKVRYIEIKRYRQRYISRYIVMGVVIYKDSEMIELGQIYNDRDRLRDRLMLRDKCRCRDKERVSDR